MKESDSASTSGILYKGATADADVGGDPAGGISMQLVAKNLEIMCGKRDFTEMLTKCIPLL